MMLTFYYERKVKDKKITLNKEARTIKETVYHITVRNNAFSFSMIEELLEKLKEEKHIVVIEELWKKYNVVYDTKANVNVPLTEVYIKDFPKEFLDSEGIQPETLKMYTIIKESVYITIKNSK